MARSRFVPRRGASRELQASPGVQRHLVGAAVITAAAVIAVAPRGPGPRGGYYKRRVKARGTRVVSEDPFWHLVELGSINNPVYAPLRRGVLAAGLRLDESPKP